MGRSFITIFVLAGALVLSTFFSLSLDAGDVRSSQTGAERKAVQQTSNSKGKKGKRSQPEISTTNDPEDRALVLESLVPTKKFSNRSVLKSVMRVPRSLFIPKEWGKNGYSGWPIPLGSGAVLPPPFQTVYAIEQLDPHSQDHVWILGAGVGYPVAILAPLCADVTATEITSSLLRKESEICKKLGIENLQIKAVAPESLEKESGSFDKILSLIPFEVKDSDWLLERLSEGGVLITPIGTQYTQSLYRFTKNKGKVDSVCLLPLFPVPSCFKSDNPADLPSDPFLQESFEGEPDGETGSIPFPAGWFDLRNATIRPDATAPDGKCVLWFDSRSVYTEQKKKDALQRRNLADFDGEIESETPSDLPDLELDELTLIQREEERVSGVSRAFAIDGKSSRKISVRCQMEGVGITPEIRHRRVVTTGVLVFFDEDWNSLQVLFPFTIKCGTTPWSEYEQSEIQVPKRAKRAVIRLGIMGGYGILKVDDLSVKSK